LGAAKFSTDEARGADPIRWPEKNESVTEHGSMRAGKKEGRGVVRAAREFISPGVPKRAGGKGFDGV